MFGLILWSLLSICKSQIVCHFDLRYWWISVLVLVGQYTFTVIVLVLTWQLSTRTCTRTCIVRTRKLSTWSKSANHLTEIYQLQPTLRLCLMFDVVHMLNLPLSRWRIICHIMFFQIDMRRCHWSKPNCIFVDWEPNTHLIFVTFAMLTLVNCWVYLTEFALHNWSVNCHLEVPTWLRSTSSRKAIRMEVAF